MYIICFHKCAYAANLWRFFYHEVTSLSCDDMNKLCVGTLAVSRKYQLNGLFLCGDKPLVSDHDFPLRRMKLCPSGYARLVLITESHSHSSRSRSRSGGCCAGGSYSECNTDSSCTSGPDYGHSGAATCADTAHRAAAGDKSCS
jgi:hypothetical protein